MGDLLQMGQVCLCSFDCDSIFGVSCCLLSGISVSSGLVVFAMSFHESVRLFITYCWLVQSSLELLRVVVACESTLEAFRVVENCWGLC